MDQIRDALRRPFDRAPELSVVTFRSGSLTLFVVGELPRTDLQTIATLIDAHLRQS